MVIPTDPNILQAGSLVGFKPNTGNITSDTDTLLLGIIHGNINVNRCNVKDAADDIMHENVPWKNIYLLLSVHDNRYLFQQNESCYASWKHVGLSKNKKETITIFTTEYYPSVFIHKDLRKKEIEVKYKHGTNGETFKLPVDLMIFDYQYPSTIKPIPALQSAAYQVLKTKIINENNARLAAERQRRHELRQQRLMEKQRVRWMGKRIDVYSTRMLSPRSRGAWWPATVTKIKIDSIQVRYDGYSSRWNEWIRTDRRDSGRIANLHKHTKKHQTHNTLSTEAQKRKHEWKQSYVGNVFRIASNNRCRYYDTCNDLMRWFVKETQINIAMFEPHGNRCFCRYCHVERRDTYTYVRGNPPQTYVLPIGYARFGIKLTSQQQNGQNILDDWHVVYHGTKVSFLSEICESGLILLKPNDFQLSQDCAKYEDIKIRPKHIPRKFERVNKYTKQRETFDPEQIFTSPSPTYSSKYCNTVDLDGLTVSFMFQCRQKPGSYSRGQETMGYENEMIDKWISNDCIEFYTKQNLNVIITGILIKVHNFSNLPRHGYYDHRFTLFT
eukprot:894279_1